MNADRIIRARYIPAIYPLLTYWHWPVQAHFHVPTTGTVMNIWDKGEYLAVLDIPELEKIKISIFQTILTRQDKLGEIREIAHQSGERVVELSRGFAEQANGADIPAYINFFNQLNESYAALSRDNMFYWVAAAPAAEEAIKAKLAKYSETEAEDILHTMSRPKITTYSQEEEIKFEQLFSLAEGKGIDAPEVVAAIRDFSAQYFWFPYEYLGPNIWDEQAVRTRVAEHLAQHVEPEELTDIAAKQAECVKKHNLSEKLVKLFDILQLMAVLQDDRKMYNNQVCYYVNQVILSELANKIGITLEQARYLDATLLETYLKDKVEFEKILAKRMDLTLAVMIDGGCDFYYTDEARKFLSDHNVPIPMGDESATEIKGQIGNRGIARGRVRMLRSSQVSDFTPGDILVTAMTTPDFVPLLKKAAAIVTDEGGITCHAAIVSRELGIPCVIGTKNATKILKDGDEVEVDAEKGIVKIIKKA